MTRLETLIELKLFNSSCLSSNLSIRAFRAYPRIELGQTVPSRAIWGNRISVSSTPSPPSYVTQSRISRFAALIDSLGSGHSASLNYREAVMIAILLIAVIIAILLIAVIIAILLIAVRPVSITRFPLTIFSPRAGLLRNPFVHR